VFKYDVRPQDFTHKRRAIMQPQGKVGLSQPALCLAVQSFSRAFTRLVPKLVARRLENELGHFEEFVFQAIAKSRGPSAQSLKIASTSAAVPENELSQAQWRAKAKTSSRRGYPSEGQALQQSAAHSMMTRDTSSLWAKEMLATALS
jgi:hypothetical protein